MTREPEWDDRERDKMAALDLYEAGVGPCGYHHSVSNDPNLLVTFETEVCLICRDLERWQRKVEDEDEKAEKALGPNILPMTIRPSDGRSMHIREVSDHPH